METLVTKHFQYTGTDDYDQSLDEQINSFFLLEKIKPDQLIDIKYGGHSTNNVATYSALMIYKK